MTVVPELAGRLTACPTVVLPSRDLAPDESVLPGFEASPELSRVVAPALRLPDPVVPDPLLPRVTACPPSDDDPEETCVGVDRD